MCMLSSLVLSPDKIEWLLLVEAAEPSPGLVEAIPLIVTVRISRPCPVSALHNIIHTVIILWQVKYRNVMTVIDVTFLVL